MHVITTAREMEACAGGVFVPTMGALHAGHAALVAAARRESVARDSAAGRRPPVVVSIFVNPTQFNQRADLDRYPRTLEADLAVCESAGADVVFAPSVEEVYPPRGGIVTPPLPDVATRPGLEDAHRPGHFAGVCQVVKRLFEIVRPVAAMFGEKDWQQLKMIQAMTRQQGMAIEIIPSATVRESDGLAMSSRNVFLSPDARQRARAIPGALCEAAAAPSVEEAEQRMRERLRAGGVEVEYAVVRDAQTLMPAAPRAQDARPMRALIAARAGDVRLIDNAPWEARTGTEPTR